MATLIIFGMIDGGEIKKTVGMRRSVRVAYENRSAKLVVSARLTKFCRWVLQGDGYEYLCLKEFPNYDCILWNNGCIAYNYRPFQ